MTKVRIAFDGDGLFVELSAGDRERPSQEQNATVEVAVSYEVGDFGSGRASRVVEDETAVVGFGLVSVDSKVRCTAADAIGQHLSFAVVG